MHTMERGLDRAYQLAYFIHGDKSVAIQIATEALNKLEVAVSAQDKRLYYAPSGRQLRERVSTDKFRTKVSLGELHLLQRLTYVESEAHERRVEQRNVNRGLNEEDMIIRYLKHLVRITLRRNSFHVTLGMSRVLHTYSTPETMEIYQMVVQNPDRVRDDDYYRARKKLLLKEIKERFGALVEPVHGFRGEERLRAHEDSSRWSVLVEECLNVFKPWDSPCVLPARIEPAGGTLSALAFANSDPDQEHVIELNRIHTVLHPDCYARLTLALGFDPPDQRLEIPMFFLNGQSDGAGPRGDRRRTPDLTDDEMASVRRTLTDQAARRRVVTAGLLSISVDGRDCARLDLNRGRRVQFEVAEGSELIEVRAWDGDDCLMLASHLLAHDELRATARPNQFAITLEGGQRLEFTVRPSRDPNGQIEGLQVDLSYKETQFRRAAALWLRRTGSRFSIWMGREGSGYSRILRPVLAIALVIAVAGSIAFLLRSTKQSNEEPLLAKLSPQPSPAPTPEDPIARTGPRRVPQSRGGDYDSTRGARSGLPASELRQVRDIYVDLLGHDRYADRLRNRVIHEIRASGRLNVVGTPERADAALRGTVIRKKSGPQVTLRLVNAGGVVLWSIKRTGTSTLEQDSEVDLAASAVKDLLSRIRIAEGKT